MLSNLFGLGFVWRHGWLAAYLMSAAVSPLLMGYLILFVEERSLHLREQYFSFIIGNSAGLAPIIATTSLMVRSLPSGSHWWTSQMWMITCFAIAASIGPLHAFVEYLGKAFTPAQFRSPAKVYHNTFVYAVLAFWIFSGTIPAIASSKEGFSGSTFGWPPTQWHIHAPGWQFYAVLAALGVFAGMVVWDSNPGHAKPHAHVPFSWTTFWHGQRQEYEEARVWWGLRVFPPRIALLCVVIGVVSAYLLLKM